MGRTTVNTGISGDRVEHLQERWQAGPVLPKPMGRVTFDAEAVRQEETA
jgi:hypothetical protein